MASTRALLVGFTEFGAAPTGEWDPTRPAAPYPSLPAVREALGALRQSLDRLPGVELAAHGPLIDHSRESVEEAWQEALGEDPGRPLLVHLAGHGVPGNVRSTLYLPVPGSDPAALPQTALAVHRWLDELEDRGQAPPTLILLDVCGAGRAVLHQLVQQVSAHRRRAWVIAASAENERAFGARFTTATAAALDRLRQGFLDVSPLLPHVPVETLAEEIHRQLVRLTPPGGDRLAQTVMRTARTQALAEIPPFFPNPDHAAGDPAAQLGRQLERALWQFAAEVDPGLDPVHFFSRATGRAPMPAEGRQPVSGCLFTGREEELDRITAWLDDTAGSAPLLVLSGAAGSGKSALLGVTVCLSHPELSHSRISDPVHMRIPAGRRPQEQPRLAAVHARGRTPRQVLASLAAQWRLGPEPLRGWTAASVCAELRDAAAGAPAVAVVDALDEAEQPDRLVTEVLLPLAAAAPLCRVAVATRPGRFPSLTAAAEREGCLVDLDAVPADRVERELTAYLEELLWREPGYRRAGPAQGSPVCAALAQRLAHGSEGGGFLAASLFAAHLCTLPGTLTPDQALALLPAEVSGLLELHLGSLDGGLAWLRPVLLAVAQGRGQGLPFNAVQALAAVFADPPGSPGSPGLPGFPCGESDGSDPEGPSRAEVREALDAAAYYLRGGTDVDGRRLYRLFHESLTEHLRAATAGAEPAVLDRLLTVLAADGWELAPAYLLRHAADHAAAADAVTGASTGTSGGALDALLTDPAYLVHAGAAAVAPHLHLATTPEARALAAVLRTSADRRPAGPEATRALLALDAARWGRPDLARAFGEVPVGGAPPPVLPLWATGGRTHPALRHILSGHAGPVTALARTDAGGASRVLTADGAGVVRVWDAADGRQLLALTGHRGEVTGLEVVTAAGRPQVIGAGADGTLRCWDLEDGRPGALCPALGGPIAVLRTALLADGSALAAAAGRDGVVRVWEPESGRLVHALAGHLGEVGALTVVTVAGRPQLLSAGADGTLRCWDLEDGRLRAACPGGGGRITAVCATPLADGTALAAAACHDGAVRVWELPGGRLLHTEADAAGPHAALAAFRSGAEPYFLSSDDAGVIRLWPPDESGGATPLVGHEGRVRALALPQQAAGSRHRPDPLLASAGQDGTIRVWELPEGRLADCLTGHRDAVTALTAWRGNGETHLLSAGRDGSARLWTLTPGSAPSDAPPPLRGHDATVTVAALCSLDGVPHALTADAGGVLEVRALRDGALRHRLALTDGQAVVSLAVTALRGRPRLLTLGADGRVRLWDPAAGVETGTLGASGVTVLCPVEVDGWPCALTGGPGGVLRLWDLSDGSLRRSLPGHGAPVVGVLATAPAGRPYALTVDATGLTLLRDLGDPSRPPHPLELTGPGGPPPRATAVSGHWAVALGGADGRTHVRGLLDERPPRRLTGHDGPVTAVAMVVSEGEPLVVTGGQDGTVRLWRPADGSPLHVLGSLGSPVSGLFPLDAEDGLPARLAATGADGGVGLWQLGPVATADGLLAFPLPAGALALCREGLLAGFGPEAAFLPWRGTGPWPEPNSRDSLEPWGKRP